MAALRKLKIGSLSFDVFEKSVLIGGNLPIITADEEMQVKILTALNRAYSAGVNDHKKAIREILGV